MICVDDNHLMVKYQLMMVTVDSKNSVIVTITIMAIMLYTLKEYVTTLKLSTMSLGTYLEVPFVLLHGNIAARNKTCLDQSEDGCAQSQRLLVGSWKLYGQGSLP